MNSADVFLAFKLAAKSALTLWVLGFFTLPFTRWLSEKINEKIHTPKRFSKYSIVAIQSTLLALGRFFVLFVVFILAFIFGW